MVKYYKGDRQALRRSRGNLLDIGWSGKVTFKLVAEEYDRTGGIIL